MMRSSDNNKPAFYVVQFLDLPFEGIDDYVCVPYTWMVVRKEIGKRSVVAYPTNEGLSKTRGRVMRKERIKNEWLFYFATVKYETDSYRDAEHWIVARKEYEVEEELKTTIPGKEQKLPLNKKSSILKRYHLSQSNDNSRQLLLEPKEQHYRKWVKFDDAAQSPSAVATDDNVEPGSSREKKFIIYQDNQPIESAQTGETASDSNDTSSSSQQKDENLQELLPIQEQRKLSPSIEGDTPTLAITRTSLTFIDDDKEVQPTSAKEQRIPSYQAISQFTKQLEPIREPQIPMASIIEITSNNQGSRMDDVLNNELSERARTSSSDEKYHLLNSLKTPAKLYSQWNEARRLKPTQKPVERKIRPMATHNYPSNLMDQTGSGSLSMCSVPTQQQHPTLSYQNQYILTNQINFKQELLKEPTESSNYNNRLNSQTISMSTPSISSTYLPTVPTHTEVINSLRQQGLPIHLEYVLNKYQLQGNHREHAFVNENHLNVIDNTLQTYEWMVEDTPSAVYHMANSDSDTVTDHEVISDHEMSTD